LAGKKMDKKIYLAIVVIIAIVLYAALVLNQLGILVLNDVFGYIYYVIIAVGIIGLIWFLVKYPRKTSTTT
jgi:protein-S-isoprenylcysteine O-methyltransferase Ste14